MILRFAFESRARHSCDGNDARWDAFQMDAEQSARSAQGRLATRGALSMVIG
jgi:hypothetical protein